MQEFFQAVAVSVLQYGCTIWTVKTIGEKTKLKLRKNATWSFKKLLETAPLQK